MTELWNTLIVWPLEGGLAALYNMLGSYGLAIIALTIGIKLVTLPLTLQQIRSSKAMRDVQPLIEEAKRRYGKDREKITQETMRIYRENGVNPAMGCLPLLIQMPVWFGLYYALINLAGTQSFASQGFLWLPSLAQPDPIYLLVILTVVTQFIVQKMMMFPSTDPQQQTMNRVMLFMPLTFGFVAMSVPSGLALYWVTTNVFTFFQQLFTTGWGSLWPGKSKTQDVAPARVQAASNPAPQGWVTEVARVPKGAKQKKRSGAKPPREEKRTNGKR